MKLHEQPRRLLVAAPQVAVDAAHAQLIDQFEPGNRQGVQVYYSTADSFPLLDLARPARGGSLAGLLFLSSATYSVEERRMGQSAESG